MYLRLFLLSFPFVLSGFAQGLTDHAAVAAGVGLGAVAGKPIGKGLGRALGETDTTLQKAAEPKTTAPKKAPLVNPVRLKTTAAAPAQDYRPRIITGPTTVSSPAPTSAVAQPSDQPEAAEPTALAPPAVLPAPAPERIAPVATRPAVTADDLRQIAAGWERMDVLARLGPPSAMVTLPEEGHLLETFRYSAAGSWLGTVRLDNGLVTRVDLAP